MCVSGLFSEAGKVLLLVCIVLVGCVYMCFWIVFRGGEDVVVGVYSVGGLCVCVFLFCFQRRERCCCLCL